MDKIDDLINDLISDTKGSGSIVDEGDGYVYIDYDADYVSAARAALRAEYDRLLEALEYYVDAVEPDWLTKIEKDDGMIARRAIKESKSTTRSAP